MRRPFFASPLLLALVVVMGACSSAIGSPPSPSEPASPSPTERPTPSPSAPEPSEPAAPASPSVQPQPTDAPGEVVRLDTPVVARVTADGVAVRVLPGLDQPLVDGYDTRGAAVPDVRLDAGHTVGVLWGPVVVDGYSWYAVQHHDTGTLTFSEGFVAAELLAVTDEPTPRFPIVAAIDGYGSGGAETAEIAAFSPLSVNVIATPLPGEASCEAEVTVIGTGGEVITVGGGEVTETTRFFGSPLEIGELYQRTEGEVTFQVRTDCSWAGVITIPLS